MTKTHENDDLWYALANNPPETFSPEEIKDIVAEVPGENDELAWWWILKLAPRKFLLLEGSCDYTGWDCQSGIVEHGIFTTPLKAAKFAPEIEERGDRKIRLNLINQLKGKYPKFTYWQEQS